MSEAPLRLVPSPTKPLSVAELGRAVKAAVEGAPALWVEGEVVQAKLSPNGHLYFDLKDDREDARMSCVMWKGSVSRNKARMVPGERVQVKGKPSVFVPRGQLQFVAEMAVPAGAGAQAAALAALKEQLRAEGLLDPARKRPLPRFPRVVGVVTSITGAALQDILREADRRFPARIAVASALVQGVDAPGQIVKALALVQRVRTLDVVIVGRGGGASEDLAAFNDERVVRAIAACRVPVVSAVGHEVDHTLADLVADHRATTPTQAAAMVTPNMAEERERLERALGRLHRGVRLRLQGARIGLARAVVPDPTRRINELRQALDDLSERARRVVDARNTEAHRRLDRSARRLMAAHPRARVKADLGRLAGLGQRLGPAVQRQVEATRQRLAELRGRLVRAMERAVALRGERLRGAAGKLDALSPVAILARGYSITLRGEAAVTEASAVQPGDSITVRLHRGALEARVTATRSE
jgi:exodeoxyribonuclease VII large subunit